MPGPVQTPAIDGGTPERSTRTDALSHDAIRHGKQKAKETMAAAGVLHVDATPSSQSGHIPPPNGNVPSNGVAPLSRKRSRDGSQKPLAEPAPDRDREHSADVDQSRQEMLLDRYMQRDMMHMAAVNDQTQRSRALIRAKEAELNFLHTDLRQRRVQDPGSVFGYGHRGYGNHVTHEPTRLVQYGDRPKGRRSQKLYISRKDVAQQADQHEELVPVRLDVELDKLRLRDTFTWNLHEKVVSTKLFTEHLLEDLKIPPESVHEVGRQVQQEMVEQIHNFYPHIIVEDGPLEPGRPYSDHKDDEMRIPVKLNITIGRVTLLDQFEWDINNPLNSPEEFARHMAWENALPGEFTTAIAHAIREQSQLYTKSLYLTNHCFDGRPIEDPELRENLLPAPLTGAFRPVQAQKDFTPYMYEMGEAEHDRIETSMMREHRAQKRQLNRRGGPALPDLKDRHRTMRSLIVHSVIPGAVADWHTTGILKTRRARGGAAGRRGTHARAPDDDDPGADSDDLGSDDSSPASPAPFGTTARTRGTMRGAASAAMRAIGRSTTPDGATGRRAAAALRDDSLASTPDPADPNVLLVRLKVPRARLRTLLADLTARKRARQFPLSGYAAPPPAPPPSSAAARGVGVAAGVAGAPPPKPPGRGRPPKAKPARPPPNPPPESALHLAPSEAASQLLPPSDDVSFRQASHAAGGE